MRYRVAAQSSRRMRLRLYVSRLTEEEAQILEEVFSRIAGVTKVTVYRATGGLALEHTCPAEDILRKLDEFRFENVVLMAKKISPAIDTAEIRERKLDPRLKKKLRMRILAESVFDLAAPAPVQLGYHVWQLITLREF